MQHSSPNQPFPPVVPGLSHSTVILQRLSGGTTVSATMIAAHRASIPVFVTGGIGGVHRDGQNSEQTRPENSCDRWISNKNPGFFSQLWTSVQTSRSSAGLPLQWFLLESSPFWTLDGPWSSWSDYWKTLLDLCCVFLPVS